MDKKKVLIAGGTGLIGSRLIQYLPKATYDISVLSRRKYADQDNIKYYTWDPDRGTMDESALKNVDVIINLAGAGIADKKWTKKRKELILTSRVNSCNTLLKYIDKEKTKPSFYFGASAVGIYGDRDEKKLTESSKPGTGFLADVTVDWEKANERIVAQVSRAVILRIGIVLSYQGGALKEILKPASAGVYGYFGNGEAYYSWIHIDDICKIIKDTIEQEKYDGIYNGTAPVPISIKDLVKAVKKAKNSLGLLLPVPKIGLQIVMGEMANMLFNSTRAIPQKLLDEGFEFDFSDLDKAIKSILKDKI